MKGYEDQIDHTKIDERCYNNSENTIEKKKFNLNITWQMCPDITLTYPHIIEMFGITFLFQNIVIYENRK